MPRRGRKRVKRRTHLKEGESQVGGAVPKTMVIPRGKVDRSVLELMMDLRNVLSPYTAQNLKVRKGNKLKDFLSIAGPIGISHILALSQSEAGVQLRIMKTPHGPTVTLRLSRYTLGTKVVASQKRPVDVATAYESPPLVVLNGFGAAIDSKQAPKQGGKEGEEEGEEGEDNAPPARALELTRNMLQGMFPPIHVPSMDLGKCRRVVLFHLDRESGTVEMRHFAVRAQTAGLSRPVRKLTVGRRLPDLGNMEDVVDLFEGGGMGGGVSDTSESEWDEDDRVAPAPPSGGGARRKSARVAVRLAELGPRITFSVLRIEDGVDTGRVLYHSLVKKTAAEEEELRRRHAERKALARFRRAEQARNVERKRTEAEAKESERVERKQRREAERALRAATSVRDEGADADDEDLTESDSSDSEDLDSSADEGPARPRAGAHTHDSDSDDEPSDEEESEEEEGFTLGDDSDAEAGEDTASPPAARVAGKKRQASRDSRPTKRSK